MQRMIDTIESTRKMLCSHSALIKYVRDIHEDGFRSMYTITHIRSFVFYNSTKLALICVGSKFRKILTHGMVLDMHVLENM